MQNLTCGSLSASLVTAELTEFQNKSMGNDEMLLCTVWNFNKIKLSYAEQRGTVRLPSHCVYRLKDSSSCLTFLGEVNK